MTLYVKACKNTSLFLSHLVKSLRFVNTQEPDADIVILTCLMTLSNLE